LPRYNEPQKNFFLRIPLGAGIGGTARLLCKKYPNITVDCYEISEKENETNKNLALRDGLQDRY
jgi:hypothetical protein